MAVFPRSKAWYFGIHRADLAPNAYPRYGNRVISRKSMPGVVNVSVPTIVPRLSIQ